MTNDFPQDAASDEPARNVASDDPFTRLEKEMTAMKNAIGDLSEQVADAASDIGAVAQSQARRGLKNARSHVNAMMSDAGVVANAAQTQASSIGDTLQDVIEERPLSTVALALGLGFLIGVTWRR